MIEIYKKVFELLNSIERRNFMVLVVVMIGEALMEMVGVSIIPIFVTTIAFPEQLNNYAITSEINNKYGEGLLGTNSLIYVGSIFLLIFFTLKLSYSGVSTYWKARYAQGRSLRFSKSLYSAYLNAPYSFHLEHGSPELMRNISSECRLLSVNVLMPMLNLISQMIILIGITLVLMLSVPMSELVWLLFFLCLGLGSAVLLNKRMRSLGHEAQNNRSMLLRVVKEGLEGAKEIKLLQRTNYFIERLGVYFARLLQIERQIKVIREVLPNLIELITIMGLVGVTIMLFLKGAEPEIVVSVLSFFAVALVRLKGCMRSIMQDYVTVQHSKVSLDTVYDGLNKSNKAGVLRNNEEAEAKLGFCDDVVISNLTYRYNDANTDALRNINLRIRKGEAIGFVGLTGAGKSTLIDIILGILKPTHGSILVDGLDTARQITSWQKNIGYIPQSIFLIDGSISQNIALGLENNAYSSDAILKAAHAANLEPLLRKLPDGLDTVVGERGILLSGGERQRIAIARALYNNPEVLVMDEATSALDNVTESTVIEEVEALKGDRTILMIAHRLSTVRRCDRIVFLKNGEVDAIGSYDELAKSHPDFMRMTGAT